MDLAEPRAARHPVSPEDAGRAGFYAVLGRLFAAAPDTAFLQALAQADELVGDDVNAALPAAWDALCAAAEAMDPEAVRDEFDALFVGVGRPLVVPYLSFYLTGFMMEKPLAELRGDLASLGYGRRGGSSEPEDHIAALAEVMRLLITDESREEGERQVIQQRFFQRYLASWYAPLCERLAAAEAANFYRCVAGFTRAFLDLEKASFDIDA